MEKLKLKLDLSLYLEELMTTKGKKLFLTVKAYGSPDLGRKEYNDKWVHIDEIKAREIIDFLKKVYPI